ncbi:MAG: hypothetical protein OXG25_06665 [Gammaproteobacteria bacterium]|nr:hypothetical protein [Gammaproteobacteria bacterium]
MVRLVDTRCRDDIAGTKFLELFASDEFAAKAQLAWWHQVYALRLGSDLPYATFVTLTCTVL